MTAQARIWHWQDRTGHGHDDDGYGVNQVDKRQSKSCLVLSRFVSCVIASATLQYGYSTYSYRNEAPSFKVQGHGKNEREQRSKLKNKKKKRERQRQGSLIRQTIHYSTDLRKTTGIKHQCTMLIIPRNHIMTSFKMHVPFNKRTRINTNFFWCKSLTLNTTYRTLPRVYQRYDIPLS